MLAIRFIMNSAVEDIFAFKTCCGLKVFDQNLEFLLTNRGPGPVTVCGFFDLKTPQGTKRFDCLLPAGDLRIEAGEVKAFYCSMDEHLWNQAEEAVFVDREGNRYPVPIKR